MVTEIETTIYAAGLQTRVQENLFQYCVHIGERGFAELRPVGPIELQGGNQAESED